MVNTVPESKYDWGLYPRGRQGKDAMALVVGPKQNVAPMKTSPRGGAHGHKTEQGLVLAFRHDV